MIRPRFSIAGLMALVLSVGVGFAALRNANAFWASATFTLAVGSVLTAGVGAAVRRGSARRAWAGFAVFGGACLVLWLARPQIGPALPLGVGGGNFGGGLGNRVLNREPMPPPPLLTEWGLRHLRPYLSPSGGPASGPFARGGFRPAGAAGTPLWLQWVFVDQILQSLDVILFGLAGAGVGHLVGRKDGETAPPSVAPDLPL